MKPANNDLPSEVTPIHSLGLPCRLGPGDGKHGATTMVWWGERHYPADLTHRVLWEKLVQTNDFLLDSFDFYDPDVGARWARVRDYVLNGGKLDGDLVSSK